MKIIYVPGYRYPSSLQEAITCGDLRYSFNLSRALARKGCDVNVVSRRGAHDPEFQEFGGVKIHRYRSELGWLFSSSFDISVGRFLRFRRLLRDSDLVITNTPFSLELMASIPSRLIYICSGLEDIRNYGTTWRERLHRSGIALLRDPLKQRTWIRSRWVNTTASGEKATLARMGVDQRKIIAIGPGVERDRYRPASKDETLTLRRHLQVRFPSIDLDTRRIILSVSRFTPAKGIVETIRAYAQLRRRTPSTVLLLVGVQHSHAPGYRRRVEQVIEELDLENHVLLREAVPESILPAYYSMAAVTTVFSVGYDPLPTVIIESMSCGTPVVATDYETRRQMVEPGETGVLVAEQDCEAWVSEVQRLLEHDHYASRLREAGLSKIDREFNMDDIAEEYLRLQTVS